jgi:DnaJ-class molecular chaperone
VAAEYELLGVKSGCTKVELTAAYRRKVSQWHPDYLERMAPELRQFATEQLARINAAYEKLTRMISGDHLSGRGDELIDLAESNLFR